MDISVEEALGQLREMFPSALWVEVTAYHDNTVGFRFITEIEDDKFEDTSLADCMAQVRAWYKEQQQ